MNCTVCEDTLVLDGDKKEVLDFSRFPCPECSRKELFADLVQKYARSAVDRAGRFSTTQHAAVVIVISDGNVYLSGSGHDQDMEIMSAFFSKQVQIQQLRAALDALER